MKSVIGLFFFLIQAYTCIRAQTTCSLDWLNNTTPAAGSLNNTFIAASTAITSYWKTTNPVFGSFNAGRPNFGNFASTLLTSSRGGGFGAKTTITFSSPVDFYRLHILDLRGDGLTSEAQKIEAYLNQVAVNRVYSTSNAALVNINTGTNTINGSATTTATSQGEVMVAFTGAVDSLIIKSTGNSDFVIIDLICPDGVQSVQLSPLQAGYEPLSGVVLNWKSYKEYNNKGFVVERSADGLYFTPIGFVAGTNFSNRIYKYRYTDNHPLPGSSYYRLEQKNFDNSYSISETVSVKINPGTKVFYHYAQKEIIFFNENKVSEFWELYNSEGMLLAKKEKGNPGNSIRVNGYPAGIYYFKLSGNGNNSTYKLIFGN
jgi:hypothetical protein